MASEIIDFLADLWFVNFPIAFLIQESVFLYPVIADYVLLALNSDYTQPEQVLDLVLPYIHEYCGIHGYPPNT